MAELVGALVELLVQLFLAVFHLAMLVIQLIGGLIGIGFEHLDKKAAKAKPPSAELNPPESER